MTDHQGVCALLPLTTERRRGTAEDAKKCDNKRKEKRESDAQDEVKGRGNSRELRWLGPGAEQREMEEKLHMMQRPPLRCHDSKESYWEPPHIYSSDHFLRRCPTATNKPLSTRSRLAFTQKNPGESAGTGSCAGARRTGGREDGEEDSVVQDAVEDRDAETCLPGHSTSETDSQGDEKELRCSLSSPRGPSVPSERSRRLSFPHN